jgi:hypothetical protein
MPKHRTDPFDPIKANLMVDYLERLPSGKWIKARDLAPIVGLTETYGNNNSKIRTLVRKTTEHMGIPIIGGNKGYKIAESEKEINEYFKKLYSEIKGHYKRINDVKIAFNIYKPGKRKGIKEILISKTDKKVKKFNLKIKKSQKLFSWMENLK